MRFFFSFVCLCMRENERISSARVQCGGRTMAVYFPLIPNLCNINEEIDAGTRTQFLSVPKSIYVCTVHTFLKLFENALYVAVSVCLYIRLSRQSHFFSLRCFFFGAFFLFIWIWIVRIMWMVSQKGPL